MILIPKIAKQGEPPKYCSVCLLDEIDKLLERILVKRIQHYVRQCRLIELSDLQFGFQSTCDALLVKRFTENVIEDKKCTIAVGIDIENAFNSLPWESILNELNERIYVDT